MSKEVEVTSIKIKMGKKEVDISIAEAHKLKEALDKLFGETITKVVREEHHHHHDRDYYPRIWWTNPTPHYRWNTGFINCNMKQGGTYDTGNAIEGNHCCATINIQ